MRDKLNDRARLALILEAIANIEQFVSGTGSEQEFVSDKILCHAVTYNIQCIGESVYMLSDEFKSNHPAMPWKSIAGQRHVLVHDYYTVSFRLIWGLVVKDIPVLKAAVKMYLEEPMPSGDGA